MAWGFLLLAVSMGATACSGECVGPGCESSWPAARLAVLRGLPEEREAVLRDVVVGTWIGALEEGAGWSVTAADARVVVGQPEADRVVQLEDREDTGPVEPLATWSGETDTSFGRSVATMLAGDGSGDFDLWVGSPEFEFAKGAVFLFRSAQRDVERSSADADLVLVGGTAGDQVGTSVVRCADLTGDRRPDLLVSAPWFATPGGSTFGAVPALAGTVFLVRSQDLEGRVGRVPIWELATIWYGSERGEGAGQSSTCDRDLDGDGVMDVAIGAPWADGGDGRVYVISGGRAASGSLDEVASAVVLAVDPGDQLGTSLATMEVGTEPALVVGAPGWREGAGRVHVFPGRQLGLELPRRLATFEAESGAFAGGHFGRWVYRADLDGDGRDDLVVGAPDDHGEGRNDFDSGRLWVWLGSGSERWAIGQPADLADHAIRGQQPFERVGRAVGVVDLDGDGRDELLVPTRGADPAAER